MLAEPVPEPSDDVELEWLVARFARRWLDDPHAQRFGRKGQRQHGIDVLATDCRSRVGETWAFQAKRTAELDPADLDAEVELLRGCPYTVHHYVVVTTAPRSARVQERAVEHTRDRGHPVVVWYWELFSELLREALGAGSWLSAGERAALRREWSTSVVTEFGARSPLHPLRLAAVGERRLSDLMVVPQLQGLGTGAAGRAAPVASLPALIAEAAEAGRLVVIASDAGAGKSTLLAATASDLARAALGDAESPLPVLVSAETLAALGTRGVADAAASGQPGPLWEDPGTDWVVLVDGLDELGAARYGRAVREVAALSRRRRVSGVAVAGRGSHASARSFPGAVFLSVSPWGAEEHERFRSRWEPSGRSRPRASSIRPLEATLSAAFEVRPGIPGARWLARQRLLDAVLDEWSASRPGPSAEPVRETLAVLALEALRSPTGAVAAEARARLGVMAADRTVERVGDRTGIARVDREGALRFPLRLCCEALAAEALAAGPVEDWAAACSTPGLAASARLAGVKRALASASSPRELLTACASHPATDVRASLRRLGVLVGVANDLGAGAGDVLGDVAQLLLREASDETSTWRRRVAGFWLAEVAADGGALWVAVRAALGDALDGSCDRAAMLWAWADATDSGAAPPPDPGFWEELLYEESPGVRSLGVQRLAVQPDSRGRRELLLYALLDPVGDSFSPVAPGVAAGWALRQQVEERAALVPELRAVLSSGHQFPAGAAAIALLPGEAPAAELLDALRTLWSADCSREAVSAVKALRGDPSAEAWIDANWPEARSLVAWDRQRVLQSPSGPGAPPSEPVRAHLLRCVAPGISATDEWRRMPWKARWDPSFLTSLCEAWSHAPVRLAPIFREMVGEARRPMPPFLPPRVQDALGAAALADQALGEALLAWSREPCDLRSSFPGVALEPLALRGFPEAAAAYAAWLPSTPFMNMFVGYPRSPAPEVLRIPVVRDAAVAWARSLWDYAAHGRPKEDGSREHLHPQALGRALGGLWPSWSGESFADELLARAVDASPGEWFRAGIEAFEPGGLPRPLAELLARRIRNWRGDREWELASLVDTARACGLVGETAEALRDVAEGVVGPAGWHAAAALIPISSKSLACVLSRVAASRFPGTLIAARLPDDALGAIVDAAPGAWVLALERAAQEYRWWAGCELVTLARVLLGRTRGTLRGRALAVVHSMEAWQLPWVQGPGFTPLRVGDAVGELLYADEGDAWR